MQLRGFSVPQINIDLIGPVGAGKTSFVNRLKNNTFSEQYIPTTERDFTHDSSFVICHRPTNNPFVHVSKWRPDVVIIVADRTSKRFKDEVIQQHEIATRLAERYGIPIVLVATKSDSDQCIVTQYDLVQCAKLLSLDGSCAVSSKTGESVRRFFDVLVKMVEKHQEVAYQLRKPTFDYYDVITLLGKQRLDIDTMLKRTWFFGKEVRSNQIILIEKLIQSLKDNPKLGMAEHIYHLKEQNKNITDPSSWQPLIALDTAYPILTEKRLLEKRVSFLRAHSRNSAFYFSVLPVEILETIVAYHLGPEVVDPVPQPKK